MQFFDKIRIDHFRAFESYYAVPYGATTAKIGRWVKGVGTKIFDGLDLDGRIIAELLGEVVTDSTKKNLQMRVDAENGATAGKFELAKLAKKYNLDAIHDTVHEMARDEARHGKAFEGLLKRYF